MKNIDEQVVQDEIISIVAYIMGELDYQVKGSYLCDNVPNFEYDVYDRLMRKVRSRMSQYAE